MEDLRKVLVETVTYINGQTLYCKLRGIERPHSKAEHDLAKRIDFILGEDYKIVTCNISLQEDYFTIYLLNSVGGDAEYSPISLLTVLSPKGCI